MKKIFTTFLLVSTFIFVPTMPASAAENAYVVEGFEEFVLVEAESLFEPIFTESSGMPAVVKPCPRGTFRVRRRTSTKKKLLNAAVSSGVGAAIGAGVGGKRGAALGAGVGAGGYLTYRFVRDRRGRCVRRYIR